MCICPSQVLGVPRERIIVAEPDTRYHAEELYVPTAACLGRPSREMFERVRARFSHSGTPAVEQSEKQARHIVVIKRHEAETRSVTNHNELEARLRFEFPADTVVVYDGTTPLGETRKIFASAQIVIAPHG